MSKKRRVSHIPTAPATSAMHSGKSKWAVEMTVGGQLGDSAKARCPNLTNAFGKPSVVCCILTASPGIPPDDGQRRKLSYTTVQSVQVWGPPHTLPRLRRPIAHTHHTTRHPHRQLFRAQATRCQHRLPIPQQRRRPGPTKHLIGDCHLFPEYLYDCFVAIIIISTVGREENPFVISHIQLSCFHIITVCRKHSTQF